MKNLNPSHHTGLTRLLLYFAVLGLGFLIPTTHAIAQASSTITIHVRGNTGAEDMTLTVNGQTLGSWSNIQSGSNYAPYNVTVNNQTTINSIRVNSTSGQGWPHALIVDRIVIDGTSYQSEVGTTQSYGSWNQSTACAQGYKYSEWLSCPNAWFEYRAAQGVVLAGSSGGSRPLVIFDTDMGPDIDDALALAMLHASESNGDAKIAAVTVSRNSDLGARYCDLLNTFYNRPDIPVGKYFGTTSKDNADYIYTGPLAQGGTYPHDVHTTGSIREGYKLMREVLASAADNSVIIAQTGFFTNTAALLASPPDNISPLTGIQLVERKVAFITIMGGRNNTPDPEFNVQIHIPSAQYVFANCPVDIIQSEFNLGYDILYPLSSIQNDFNYVTNHPVKDAYLHTDISWHHDNGNSYDMRTWDLTSILVATEPISEYFDLGTRGNVVVQNNGRTIFTANPNGKVRSLGYSWDYTSAEKQKMINRMIELTSQPPGTGNSGSSTITIYARGNTGAEDMTLTVNGQVLGSWNNIPSGDYRSYDVTVTNQTTINSIRVNSTSGQPWEHALVVDRIVIDGTSYQSEASTTRSYGSWNPSTSCAEGYKYSEWLSCPYGWFEYKAAQGVVLAGENPNSGTSTITVHARGNTGAEDMTLTVNGQVLGSWNNIPSGDYRSYDVTVTNQTTINSIRVNSTSGQPWEHALVVDRIVIDGTSYQSEADNTRSYGSWNPSTSCAEGYKNSEWLSCPYAWFEYRAAQGVVLASSQNREGIETITNYEVFPNPVSDNLNISLDLTDGYDTGIIRLFDLNGRIILEEEKALSNINQFQLNIQTIPAGVYMLRVDVGGYFLTHRVVKY